jgi:hypothetical protein
MAVTAHGVFDRLAVPDYRGPELGQISAPLRQRRRSVTQEGSTLAGEETAQPVTFAIAFMVHSDVDRRNLRP